MERYHIVLIYIQFLFNFSSISCSIFFSISCSISVPFQFFFNSFFILSRSHFRFLPNFCLLFNCIEFLMSFYYITGNGKRKGKGKNGGKGKRKDCRQSRKLIYQVCERFSVINYGMGSGKGKKGFNFLIFDNANIVKFFYSFVINWP